MLKVKLPIQKVSGITETFNVSVRTLKMVWQIDKWLFLGAFVANIIPAIIPFINIYIYKLIIDLVIAVLDGQPFDPANFYPLVVLRVLTYFISDSTFGAQEYVARLLWAKVPIYLDQLYFKKVASLDMHYYESDKFHDLLEKSKEGSGFRPQQLIESLFYCFQSFLQFIIALFALVNLNWFFILLVSIVSIPQFFVESYQAKLSWSIWGVQSPHRKRYHYLTRMLEGPREIKEVKIFNLAERFLSEVKILQQGFYEDTKQIASKGFRLGLSSNFISTLAFISIEVFIILQALQRKLTVGDISFYTGVVSNYQNGLGGLFRNLNRIFESSLYVKSMFDILDSEPIIKAPEKPIRLNLKTAPTIEFNDVDFAYPGTTKKILKSFSLIINPGEKIAFVGENGAGKSTIIKLLARFYDVNKGEILINGINIKDLDLAEWYSYLGILFQDFNRYEHTIKENIYFGSVEKQMDLKSIIEASISAGSNSFVNKFDKGYEQMLGKMFEGGVELSAGQWQKLALARAFFRNAPVLVLDEPTSSIDAKAESEIFGRVEKLSKNKTVLIISHRFSTVRNADKIYVIEDGKIAESGTHQELMKLDSQYATLFRLQAKGYQ